MARIIGQVESLKTLKAELNKRNISRFSSVGDIKRFCKEFSKEKQIVLESQENSLIEEIKLKSERIRDNGNRLELVRNIEIGRLNASIESYKKSKENLEKKRSSAFFLFKVILFFRIRKLNKKLLYLTDNYELIINSSIRDIQKEIYHDSNSLTYLSENKQKVIYERSKPEINQLEHARKAIDELRPLIAGAVGESLVEKEIGKLSDNYTLINDYNLKFRHPVYNRKTNDRIYSIQLDHLLVSQAGIFILETKNWSKKSINSFDLRSPVDQIIRTNYALFVVANNKIRLDKHHWGTKQIPIRSIIVMIHSKPKEEFKYVKIKLLKELNSYLEYFDPILSNSEVESVANSLLRKGN
ncbi:nuclease-related domain-containing protein [Arenibacter sp. S6351L]|uniref:nuclease-related domain-containing protein n=1 Tax=Arenibacter sp. S6351L TaxID=2926407 RepID=UPI001FF43292|nr:nuclease-related domain-containing protein [Arenibacter sp. S6351L]MCK0137375.1 NERD domain-containing protein [Arenibacter sp. S6351L]